MPWRHFVTLLAKAAQFTARELHHAMKAHIWALGARESNDQSFRQEFERVRQLAYPGSAAEPVIILKQSID